MAIPDWTWDERGPPSVPAVETGSLEPVSEAFGAISNPDRLAILLVLARDDGPVDYSSLRTATDVEDKGRFNYHLRQLREEFVRKDETTAGYELTDVGRTLVRTVLRDDRFHGTDGR